MIDNQYSFEKSKNSNAWPGCSTTPYLDIDTASVKVISEVIADRFRHYASLEEKYQLKK